MTYSAPGPYSGPPAGSLTLEHSVDAPLNREPAVSDLIANFITPASLSYDRNHSAIPHLDRAQHRVVVDFDLDFDRDLDLDLDLLSIEQLATDFAQHAVTCALQCAGNRRHTMRSRLRQVHGVDWGDGAVMNCGWRGPRLRDVLLRAGVGDGGDGGDGGEQCDSGHHVAFACRATPCQDDGWYGASIELGRAMSVAAEVILALEMNGQPLLPKHGFPVRVIAPGVAGARSVKWLDRITVQARESDNYYQQHDYKILPPHVRDWAAAEPVWATLPAVQDMPVNSAIGCPAEGETLRGGRVVVRGYALPQGDQGPVVRVDVSVDEGRSWIEAEIWDPLPPDDAAPGGGAGGGHESGAGAGAAVTTAAAHRGKWTWVRWSATVCLSPGSRRRILSRARDAAGNVQPACPVWNLRGVNYNGYGEVRDLTVE
ncbi:MAG: hypothetical protein M1826_001831 [Phylliscum demangeonii]|nr:MAG: hypothetical protein M1826_001831 [Phylliscum demangeonii]